ncbi:MAG: translation initiation factor IF-3 [Proteobacteria bacterium]|nr:translation initiation factor IF-3 [Pseudomonadota bacterium]MCH8196507.1 translation initiation factor IF-3 [Pseudomonadota bacterium]
MPPVRVGPRANDQITVPAVRLIDDKGEQVGIVSTEEARGMADEVGLDLVEVAPNAEPPVCKLLDYGKFKYTSQKKASEARKRQKTIDVKEIKMRPGIDRHDYDVKMRSIVKFLDEGDKVKLTLRFRGREMVHQDIGRRVLQRVCDDLGDMVKIEQSPKLEGRQMTMVMSAK